MSTVPDLKKMPVAARFLIQDQLIPDVKVNELYQQSVSEKLDFITFLVKNKHVSQLDLALYLAQKFNLPYFDLDSFDSQFIPANVDPKLIRNTQAIPLSKRGKMLYVAVANPGNETAINDLKFQMQASATTAIVVEVEKLNALIEKVAQSKDTSLSSSLKSTENFHDLLGDMEDTSVEQNEDKGATADVDDAPVVKFLQQVLLEGIERGASDIHFEPYEKFYRIRFRQDGILYQYMEVPLQIKDKLASRIKVISKLDISNKLTPQDGRLKLKINQTRAIDFRVSSLPTLFGEKIVMRILDPSSAKLGIDALGYDPDQKENLLNAVARPYGMVLVTGPTGSGKTVSLYTCLNNLNDVGRNISTAEDPAEINLPGINQVNVNDKAGLTFSVALKSFLRQDPDVIMVGEIRDLETADIAMKAALTGHMVLSTLHTNDAPSTLTRLLDMGVAPFNIASAVSLITAQRLARRLCKHCKAIEDISADHLKQAGMTDSDLEGYQSSWHCYKAVGCPQCNHGYKGRVGIYQVMPVTEEMKKVILDSGTSMEIAEIAKKQGIRDLRQSGLLKIKQGHTSLEEILSVTNLD